MRPDVYGLCAAHEESHWWYRGRRDILMALIRSLRSRGRLPAGSMRILDYGCGTGGMTRALAVFGQVTGYDAEEEALARCRARGLDVRKAADPPDILEEAFDLACCLDVLEHVSDDVGLLAALRHSLKPGGLLVLTVPALPVLWGGEDVVSRHLRRYRRGEVRTACAKAGLRPLLLGYFNTFLFPAILARRVSDRLFRPQRLQRSDVVPAGPVLNRFLHGLFASERHFLGAGAFPIGASLLLVAEEA